MFVPIDSVDHADLLSFCDRCHVTPPGLAESRSKCKSGPDLTIPNYDFFT